MPKKSKSRSIEDVLKIDPRLLWRIVRKSGQYLGAVNRFVDGATAANDGLALDLYAATETNSTLDLFPEAVGSSTPRDTWGFAVPPLPLSGDALLSEYRLNPDAQHIRSFQTDTRQMFSFPIQPENATPDYDVLALCWNFYPAARIFRDEKSPRPFGFLEGMRAEDGNRDIITIRVDHRFPKAIIQGSCQLIIEDYLANRRDTRGFLRINDRDKQEGSTVVQRIECWELRKEGSTKIEAFEAVWPSERKLNPSAKKKRVDSSVGAVDKVVKALWESP